jgi:hypothetical protein
MQKIKLFIALALFIGAGVFSFTHNTKNSLANGSGTYRTGTYCKVVDLNDNCDRVNIPYYLSNCDDWSNYPDESSCTTGGGGGEEPEEQYEQWQETCSKPVTEYTCNQGCCESEDVTIFGTRDVCISGTELVTCEDGDCDVSFASECTSNDQCTGNCF